MNIRLNTKIAENYKSKSQKIRVITESWLRQNGYCPNCGSSLYAFQNNKPVADFLCKACSEKFELKSKNSKNTGRKIVDGAYHTMIKRIEEENNPNFFFLTYDKTNFEINNFLVIPNFYFTPGIIEKRKALASTARRAGWVGCNSLLQRIPESGRIYLIKDAAVVDKRKVLDSWSKTSFLKDKKGESRGWLLDVMNCVDRINSETFYLDDIYKFEQTLKEKHPKNNFIREKIRQQLQILIDRGVIEFLGRGKYKKTSS